MLRILFATLLKHTAVLFEQIIDSLTPQSCAPTGRDLVREKNGNEERVVRVSRRTPGCVVWKVQSEEHAFMCLATFVC